MSSIKISYICVVICFSNIIYSHDHTFDVPVTFYSKPFTNPARYMETYAGSVERLSCKKFLELKNLFISAAYYSKLNYGQDYMLSTSSKIYKLLQLQLTKDIKIKTKEKNKIVMLGDIAEQLMINSKKLYEKKCEPIKKTK